MAYHCLCAVCPYLRFLRTDQGIPFGKSAHHVQGAAVSLHDRIRTGLGVLRVVLRCKASGRQFPVFGRRPVENGWDVLRDIGITFVFWMVVITMLVGLRVVLGQNPQMLRAARIVSPQNTQEMILWACVALAAGTCEEFVFRGYLQKQFQAITGSDVAAVGLQAIVFGAAHSYQGVKGMITITVYGALFGILAVYRKSLRPGMIQHVMQDTSAGIIGALFLKRLGKTPAIFF